MAYSNDFTAFLKSFKTDNIHGANYLATKLLKALDSELIYYNRDNRNKILQHILADLQGVHPDLVEIQNIIQLLEKEPTYKNVKRILNLYNKLKYIVSKKTTHWLIENKITSVLTISNSSLVEESLVQWTNNYKGSKPIIIHILESRPLLEGKFLLQNLCQKIKNVQFYYWIDAALGLALKKTNCVLLGADRIYRNNSVVNKVGSLPLAITAHSFNIPVLVIGSSFKIDNNEMNNSVDKSNLKQRKHPEIEIITKNDSFCETASINNYYFDRIPIKYITEIIIEDQ